MGGANDYVSDIMARFADFVGPGVQWQRTLWGAGLAFALREILEVSDGVQHGALSAKALKRHADSVARAVGNDPAAGDETPRRRLKALLTQDLSAGGAHYYELGTWLEDVERHGLTRWRAAVNSANKPSRERVARALASELFRHGFSAEHLHRWIRTLQGSETPILQDDLISRADHLIASGPQPYAVMVAFSRPPDTRLSRPEEWRSPTDVSQWLGNHGIAKVRQHGGLLLEIEARDPHSAGRIAVDTADRLSARAAVGTRDKIDFLDEVFVAGHTQPIAAGRSRRAEVRALERENKLLDLAASGIVDQALELLSHLNTAPAPVAAATGWAAVESLLSGPGDDDKVVTAERLADLVACSWPRAELTTIAWARVYQASGETDELANELRGCATNRERADRILRAIVEGEDLRLRRPAERLALRRMEALIRDPRRELIAVRERAGDALRRLYRQRNLVVHGGQTAGFGLATAVRTAAPLVGAGLDRVTHAQLVNGVRPLEIAARARLEIERAGTTHTSPLTGMLE